MNLVLASGSPRRRELLERMGVPFTVRVPDVEERVPEGLPPRATVEAISREKAEAAESRPGELVITADTMVFLDGARLGKPADEDDALRMLLSLQGRRHVVCTGVTVRRDAEFRTDSEETAVYFRPASREELLRYVRTGEPMDKAGAYGLQGRGALLVRRLEGDYSNVIGLPLPLLARMLASFGVTLL